MPRYRWMTPARRGRPGSRALTEITCPRCQAITETKAPSGAWVWCAGKCGRHVKVDRWPLFTAYLAEEGDRDRALRQRELARRAARLVRDRRSRASMPAATRRVSDQLAWFASEILAGRCELTGEDPGTVLDALETRLVAALSS